MGTKWAHVSAPRHDVPVPGDETITETPERGWLLIAVGEGRQYGGNDGYDDSPDVHYSWDSTVNNAKALQVGDPIALWDKSVLLGISVIEEIETGVGEKVLKSCPTCGKSSIKARKTKSPLYRCHECSSEFDEPATSATVVQTYRSRHDGGWTGLNGALEAQELRELCVNPGDQLSLRRLRWDAFTRRLAEIVGPEVLGTTSARVPEGSQGHVSATVRVRVGQSSFRRNLLRHQKAVCAFTGAAPEQILEAGHLYSYAELGVHHEHGGLLMRRDIHRLFDEGLIGIHPETHTVVVTSDLSDFPQYAILNGSPIRTALATGHIHWLHRHWTQHHLGSRQLTQ